MSSIIDSISKINEQYQVSLGSKTGDSTKILTFDDIKDTVALYRLIFQGLQKTGCEKFIHEMKAEDLESIMSEKSQAIVGYFRDKQLVGALYTKPFEQNNQFFKTPKFDGNQTTYAIGGLAVNPEFRGNGIINKLASVVYNGVKDFSNSSPESQIAGMGAEISCENFNSLSSVGLLKTDSGENMLNFTGYHYIQNPQTDDNDLTILGYGSFQTTPIEIATPSIILNGNQQQSFAEVTSAVSKIAEQTNGATLTEVDGHNIVTLNSYIHAPYRDILSLQMQENPPTQEA